MKKGQGLSVNTIVVAALAITILIILILVFTGRINWFTRNIDDCENKGNTCVLDKTVGCTSKNGALQTFLTCPDVGTQKQYCCKFITS